jgi:hypothetical protein
MPTKKKHNKKSPAEPDSVYFLKLILYVILGLTWLKFAEPVMIGDFTLFGLPLGFVLGLILASHDHFQIDRKIEYAILIITVVVGFVIPYLSIFV